MIPVLGLPLLNKVDLFERMMTGIDYPVDLLYVVNNGSVRVGMQYRNVSRIHVADLGYNAGVAASWNLIIKANMNAPYWVIGCNDMIIEKGIFAEIEQKMTEVGDSQPHLLRVRIGNEDWGNHFGLFAMNAALVDRVGWFDENLHPVYWEDTDYLARIHNVGGVRMTLIGSRSHHDGNMSWKGNPKLEAANKRSWDSNVKYFDEKWGTHNPSGTHKTPFDRGGKISEWAQPSLSRLRHNQWKEMND